MHARSNPVPYEVGRGPVGDRRRRRVVALVFVTVFLDLIGFGVLLPLLPFFVESAGGTPQAVGAMLATFSVSQLLATPALGRWADRVGRRPVMVLSLAGNAVAMALFAVAAAQASLALAFASRLLAGVTAGNLAACQAAVADVTGVEDRSRSMGLIGAAIGLGMILGPVIGGALSAVAIWAPPLAAAGLAAVDLVAVLLLMPETAPRRAAAAAPAHAPRTRIAAEAGPPLARLARGPVVAVLALYALTFVCLAAVQATLPLLARVTLGWNVREVGIVFGAMGLGSLVVQGALIGPLASRFGAVPLVGAGLALLCGALVVIGTADTAGPLVAGTLAVGVGVGLVLPSLATVAADLAGPHEQGTVLGFAQSSGGLGRTLGPLAAGALYTRLGPPAPFLSAAATAAIAVALAVALALTLARRRTPLHPRRARQ